MTFVDQLTAPARAIHEFQELVAKRIAKKESGKLGSRITDEENDSVVGGLIGLLPGSRRFEMKLVSGEVIRGGVAADVGPLYLELIGTPDQAPVGRTWRTKMRVATESGSMPWI